TGLAGAPYERLCTAVPPSPVARSSSIGIAKPLITSAPSEVSLCLAKLPDCPKAQPSSHKGVGKRELVCLELIHKMTALPALRDRNGGLLYALTLGARQFNPTIAAHS